MRHTLATLIRFFIAAMLALVLASSSSRRVLAQSPSGTPYIVQPGDTLARIALLNNLTPEELARANGIVNPGNLQPGQEIILPPHILPAPNANNPIFVLTHTVQRGENPHSIALLYGTDEAAILHANVLDDSSPLQPGRVLAVVLFGRQLTGGSLPTVYETLDSGESLSHVALRQSAHRAALAVYNQLSLGVAVLPGIEIVIPPAARLLLSAGQAVAEFPSATPLLPPTATATLPPATDLPTPTPESSPTPPQATPTETPLPPHAQNLEVRFGDLIPINDGRAATIDITVINTNVKPAIEGGLHYFEPNPDGGLQWVTLLGVTHDIVPLAQIGKAPLWKATVTTTDGKVWDFYAGCVYLEEVNYTGYEPTGPDSGFHWDVNWTGGFYDCGNAYHVKPNDIVPGSSATVPLTIYLQHPRVWDAEPPPARRVARIDLSLWRSDGLWLGIVATVAFP